MSVFFGAAEETAYRFQLPAGIGPPPAAGDKVDVACAFVADTHAHLLGTSNSIIQHLAKPRNILDQLHAVQIVIDNVLWLVPMTTKTDKEEVTISSVKAHRWLLSPTQAAMASDPPSSPSPDRPSRLFRRSWEDFRPRWDWGEPAPYHYRSRMPPPLGYGPLSSRISEDANVVANFPVYGTGAEETMEEDYEDNTIEYELPINVAFEGTIKYTRYVDFLPQGEPFPDNAKLIDTRLGPNPVWAVDKSLQTYCVATKMNPELRMRAWRLLTTPGLGHPGEIMGDEFHYTLTNLCSREFVDSKELKSGPAVLKLIPVGDAYACQPASASPEASYILNNWRVVVEQNGTQVDLFQPLAVEVDWEKRMTFEHLAELASAERAPGEIVYGKLAYWYCEEVSGYGVRLRDGGSRLPLKAKEGGPHQLQVPADPHLHSKWGHFDGKHRKIPLDRFPKQPVMADVRIEVPKGAHDIVMRVNESDVGQFHRLEYVLRPQGSYQPIKEDEWRPLGPQQLDAWVLCFFINLAKVTYGCLNKDLIRPSFMLGATTASNLGPSTASAPGSSTGQAAEASSGKIIKAESNKKPRIS